MAKISIGLNAAPLLAFERKSDGTGGVWFKTK
jgi:hypothetical protein